MSDLGTDAAGEDLDLTVVVTCYNEAAFIKAALDSLLAAIAEFDFSYEVIVIDDASRDNSVQRVREYIATRPNLPIRLKANAVNQGFGNNFVDGAFMGRGKYYRLCSGKDAEPKEVIVNLLNQIGKAEIIIPYNYRPVIGKSRMRNFLSGTYTVLVNFISGYEIRYYNGLGIHLRQNILRWHSSTFGFGFQADIITRLLDEGVSYLQVPTYSIDRKGSASTALRMRNILSVAHTLLEIGIRRLRNYLYGRMTPVPLEILLDATSEPNPAQ